MKQVVINLCGLLAFSSISDYCDSHPEQLSNIIFKMLYNYFYFLYTYTIHIYIK